MIEFDNLTFIYDNKPLRVCQNTLFITKDRYIAELSYEVAI